MLQACFMVLENYTILANSSILDHSSLDILVGMENYNIILLLPIYSNTNQQIDNTSTNSSKSENPKNSLFLSTGMPTLDNSKREESLVLDNYGFQMETK